MRFGAPFVLVCAVAVSGCGAAVRDIAGSATEGTVQAGVAELTDRRTQQKLASGIDEELLAKATDRVVSGVVDGTLASIDDPARREQMRRQFADLMRGARLPLTIERIDKNTIGDIVDESIERMLSDERQAALRTGVRMLVKDVVAAAFEQARAEVSDDDVEDALSSVARTAAKQATLGFQDAIDETTRRKRDGELRKEEGNLLSAAGNVAQGSSLLWLIVAGAFGFFVALICAILWAGRHKRETRTELARRDDALLALLGAIKSTEHEAWSSELREKLKDALRDRDGSEHVRRVLREHQDLRLSRSRQSGAFPKRPATRSA